MTTRRYRLTSRAIYGAALSAEGVRPDIVANISGEAFGASDHLRYPTGARRAEVEGRLPYPTRAKYWTQYPASRLLSRSKLRGESSARRDKRLAMARSYFARQRAADRKRAPREWRLVLKGTVTVTKYGKETSYPAVQYGPWQPMPTGGLTDAQIRNAYLDVARYMVATTGADQRVPNMQGTHSNDGLREYRKKGESQEATLDIDSADLETRNVPT